LEFRTVKSKIQDVAGFVETGAELFADGASIELIRDPEIGKLSLLLTTNQTHKTGSQIEYYGRIYRPLRLDAPTLRAITFPKEPANYGTTRELFSEIRHEFQDRGYSDESSLIGTYFPFSTWFSDCISEAPSLLVSGPQVEARLFFQLLRCLVRRPLQIVDVSRSSFSLFSKIQPTLLFPQNILSPSKMRMLAASNIPQSYIHLGGELSSFCSAKAIYVGTRPVEDPLGEARLRINLSPLRGKLPILDSNAQMKIAERFQPMLLAYRARNFEKVRLSSFDFPWLTSGMRIIAQTLGACIVEDPELQADLSSFFHNQQSASRERIWLDPRCLALEVGVAFCHRGQEVSKVYVGQFAEDVNTLLKGRGHSALIEAKEMGSILRSLGFSPKRDSGGYSLRLTDEIRRQAHKLAFDFDVAALLDGEVRCSHCSEILKKDTAENLSAPDQGGTPGPNP
jgi:hypothetical protein